jgi:hypothetical protein
MLQQTAASVIRRDAKERASDDFDTFRQRYPAGTIQAKQGTYLAGDPDHNSSRPRDLADSERTESAATL